MSKRESATRLLVATHNPGKMQEYRVLLAPLPAGISFPAVLGIHLRIRETGVTYAENARLKATSYAQSSGLLTLADDSGLEVDALAGAPGLHSARYVSGTDLDRVQALLKNLQGVPWAQRTARFRCVIAIVTRDNQVYEAEGVCEGIIAYERAGEEGFGYDPIFYLPEYGLTMAQVPRETKNRISHRARAVRAAMPTLRRLLGEDGFSRAGSRTVSP